MEEALKDYIFKVINGERNINNINMKYEAEMRYNPEAAQYYKMMVENTMLMKKAYSKIEEIKEEPEDKVASKDIMESMGITRIKVPLRLILSEGIAKNGGADNIEVKISEIELKDSSEYSIECIRSSGNTITLELINVDGTPVDENVTVELDFFINNEHKRINKTFIDGFCKVILIDDDKIKFDGDESKVVLNIKKLPNKE